MLLQRVLRDPKSFPDIFKDMKWNNIQTSYNSGHETPISAFSLSDSEPRTHGQIYQFKSFSNGRGKKKKNLTLKNKPWDMAMPAARGKYTVSFGMVYSLNNFIIELNIKSLIIRISA